LKVKNIIEEKYNYYIDKIKLLEDKNKEYEKENKELLNKVILLEKENKLNKEKLIENTSNPVFFKNNKKELDTNFQIDINLNNKQLNKAKFKDVPENIVKKEIQSLKLKDNYQLEYREEDGYINITNLCKAGGREFKSWNRLNKTKLFLDVLSTEVKINTSALIKVGSGSKFVNDTNNQTWAHPQVAINISQWISPEFDVLVSKWVYEIILTGKVDISNQKTTLELDQLNKDNKLLINRIKLLESKVLQKQPRESYENSKNVIYIVTTEYKEAQGHYKIGKTQDLKNRLSTYNTTDKHEVIYYTNCKSKKKLDLLEQLVHDKLEDKRIEPNKEWFLSEEDAEDFIEVINDCKKFLNF
jgi:hypothetical protein